MRALHQASQGHHPTSTAPQHRIPQSRRPQSLCSCHLDWSESAAQHQHPLGEQYSSTSQQQRPVTQIQSPSRRSMLQQAAVTWLTLPSLVAQIAGCVAPLPAHAYIVDEVVAQSVFAIASRSVVSINDYKVQGGAEIMEGVGTGIVWDKYGHSEYLAVQALCGLCKLRSAVCYNLLLYTLRPHSIGMLS